MPVLFAVTLFVSASLLFMVQPMVGRMILPLLGGSPAAWNTCMVFFQMMLLLGYLYAHKVTTRISPAKQVWLHAAVLGGAACVLAIAAILSERHTPIAVLKSLAPQDTSYPMFGVLALLFVAIGIPFFAVATSAPLLQRWFAYTGHPASKDPYFLYAASNAGSLISLLGYPLVTEPRLRLVEQTWVWAVGFLLLAVLTFVCGTKVSASVAAKPEPLPDPGPPPTRGRKFRWVALAFVPSSLMLGVTFHMTTDITSVTHLWVIPLALYLLTFIIAFARLPGWFRPLIANVSPVVTLLLVFVMTSETSMSTFLLLGLHLVAYFLAALMCHTELAHDRPPPQYLTDFFLWISVGGMLGGVFNALVAPICFSMAYEYPIAIAVGCMLIPSFESIAPSARKRTPKPPRPGVLGYLDVSYRALTWITRLAWLDEIGSWIDDTTIAVFDFHGASRSSTEARAKAKLARGGVFWDIVTAILMAGAVYGLTKLVRFDWFGDACNWLAVNLTAAFAFCRIPIEIGPSKPMEVLFYAVPAMACFFFVDRPLRFGLCVAAILGVNQYRSGERDLVKSERSFFGILKVMEDRSPMRPDWDLDEEIPLDKLPDMLDYTRLLHGTTLHGTQAKEPDYFGRRYRPWFRSALGVVSGPAGVHAYNLRGEPLTYYHRTGPVGHMFRVLDQTHPGAAFGMVGLGTGSVSCYAKPGQNLTFYEIDPSVRKLVADTDKYFTYVTDARNRGANVEIVMGDARLKLEEERDRKFQLLLIDAFSSDSIPVHLLTREAVALYMERVPDDGIVALHISNKYVMLDVVAARIAEELNLTALVLNDGWSDEEADAIKKKGDLVPPGKTQSSWVVLARKPDTLAPFLGDEFKTQFGRAWHPLETDPAVRVWTDDYSDVLSVMMIKEVQRVRSMLGLPVVRDLLK